MEAAEGERLRLDAKRDCFSDDAAAQVLSEALAEGQPPVLVSALTLRQWYAKSHPESGPLRVETEYLTVQSFFSTEKAVPCTCMTVGPTAGTAAFGRW